MRLLIKDGHLVDPSQELDQVADLSIVDGRVDSVSTEGIAPDGYDDVIHADGLTVAPGFIDMHVHLREPGHEHRETIGTGTAAAVAGGFTTVAMMPNTEPPLDSGALVKSVRARAEQTARTRVEVIGTITKGRRGAEISEMADMKRVGIVAVSDDGSDVADADVLRRAMEYARSLDLTVICHCEDVALAADGVMNEGVMSTRFGLPGNPAMAEYAMVARNIALAEDTGCQLHIAHVSCRRSVNIIREARKSGIRVTSEVTPHHLALTDEAVASYDPNFRMRPPLRTRDDVESLIEGVADGTIDVIATDHAPHSLEEKDVEFQCAPDGVIGLETCLTVVLTELVSSNRISLSRVIEMLSVMPAKVLGLPGRGSLAPGSLADITVFDPKARTVVDSSRFHSKSRNTPFSGYQGVGVVRRVLVGGEERFSS